MTTDGPLAESMDRRLTPSSLWRRYALHAVAAVVVLAVGIWLIGGLRGRSYRVPLNQSTIAAVTRGPFEDHIAVRGTAAPLATHFLTAEQGGVVKEVLVEDGANVKARHPLIVLSNGALELQVASREADTAGQINASENTKIQLEETRFKYEHDLLDNEHQISKLTGDLARDKIRLDGNAIAPAIYQQEQEEYAYEVKLRDATTASGDAEKAVRANQVKQPQDTLVRLKTSSATAAASLDALTIRAPTDGQLTALTAEVGQSKPQGAVLGQVDSLDRFKLAALVDEFYLGRIMLGQSAIFSSDGGDYRAALAKIYPQVANGTFRIDLHFENPPQGIHTGQAFDIKLELDKPDHGTL
jgi:HlyD family secretion protein